jgi:hypothetical protein
MILYKGKVPIQFSWRNMMRSLIAETFDEIRSGEMTKVNILFSFSAMIAVVYFFLGDIL